MAKKKKRKKKGGAGAQQKVQVAPEKPKTWWELWEEFEDIRRNAYDVLVSASSSHYVLPSSALNDRIGTWLL
jgi:alpha-D-ribose 1-methylphosphonate 5-triphosphate synthase subunit PhnH